MHWPLSGVMGGREGRRRLARGVSGGTMRRRRAERHARGTNAPCARCGAGGEVRNENARRRPGKPGTPARFASPASAVGVHHAPLARGGARGGLHQPSGSMPGPSPAVRWVVVFIRGLRWVEAPARSAVGIDSRAVAVGVDGGAAAGAKVRVDVHGASSLGLQPFGSIPAPLPSGSMQPPSPARTPAVVCIVVSPRGRASAAAVGVDSPAAAGGHVGGRLHEVISRVRWVDSGWPAGRAASPHGE